VNGDGSSSGKWPPDAKPESVRRALLGCPGIRASPHCTDSSVEDAERNRGRINVLRSRARITRKTSIEGRDSVTCSPIPGTCANVATATSIGTRAHPPVIGQASRGMTLSGVFG
jgi:hypothetical protein